MTQSLKTIAIIPARGGSKGIPRKNIRDLNGKPLIWYTIHTALDSGCFTEVLLSTDDDEIAHVGAECGATIHKRPAHLASDQATLDPVVFDAVGGEPENYDLIVTLQPTCPLLKVDTLREALSKMISEPNIDTLLSVTNDPRLAWIEKDGKIVPGYEERVNRQQLPPYYRETGAFFISRSRCVKENSRFGEKVGVFEVSPMEAIDIDTIADWWIVEKYLKTLKIALRVDGNRSIGFGHVYRMLLLANRLFDHRVEFFLDQKDEEAVDKVRKSFYPLVAGERENLPGLVLERQPDIVIHDILDTTAEGLSPFKQKGIFTVNFEDLGPGIAEADLVINALYETDIPYPHVYSGPDYYCLREDFAHTQIRELSPEVQKIVVSFGGADPSDLTAKTVKTLAEFLKDRNVQVGIVLGLGYPVDAEKKLESDLERNGLPEKIVLKRNVASMAAAMKEADLILTSCGRTMYEVASLGIPAILMAQNTRELHHTFGHADNGFSNLGLGGEVSSERLLETIARIADDFELRKEMRTRMLKTDFRKGLARVESLILDSYWEWKEK